MKIRHIIILSGLLAAFAGHAATNAPSFDEIYNLLRTHLDGISKADLDSAAIKGLLDQIPAQAKLISGSGFTNATAADALSKSAIYDDSFAYIRIAKVDGDIAGKLKAAYHQLAETNKTKIKGVVLDLRSTSGGDYSAAGAVADCFLNAEQPLLNWGTGSVNSTKKDDAIAVPVAILVNAETSGAAEALAAVLREMHEGLLVGGKTAGEAHLFKDFPLSNGDKLRIASSLVKLGNGTVLSESLQPDIAVETSLDDDKAYLKDPYKILHEPDLATISGNSTNASETATNALSHHRLNEAELVREQKEGADLEDEFGSGKPFKEPSDHPLLKDPALLRALDVLKGLAVVQLAHPG